MKPYERASHQCRGYVQYCASLLVQALSFIVCNQSLCTVNQAFLRRRRSPQCAVTRQNQILGQGGKRLSRFCRWIVRWVFCMVSRSNESWGGPAHVVQYVHIITIQGPSWILYDSHTVPPPSWVPPEQNPNRGTFFTR